MICPLFIVSWLSLTPVVVQAADLPLQKGQGQFETGNYREAAATLRAATGEVSRNAQLQYWLARCYYELRDYDHAVTYAENAVSLDPQNSEYHQWLGRAYGGKAKESRSFFLARKVRREFEEAVRRKPSNITARRDLIDFYLEAPWIVGGDKAKAWQQAEAIAALDPVEGHLARATYWIRLEKSEQAESEYRRALDLQPQRMEPYLETADFYQERKDARMAEAVEKGARVNPLDQRLAYYRGVGRILADRQLPEAEQFLKSYLATVPQRSDFPSHASAHEWLGRLYELQGKRAEAAGEYRAALQLDPNRESARASLRRAEKP
ncbi:MAG: tetratricopeptide repeat protein [Acidobacteria bacterium]|nr:tetratricopeptide repeat protein [Acidobacteriota bacterium]